MEVLFFAFLGFLAADLFIIAVMAINIGNSIRQIRNWLTGIHAELARIGNELHTQNRRQE